MDILPLALENIILEMKLDMEILDTRVKYDHVVKDLNLIKSYEIDLGNDIPAHVLFTKKRYVRYYISGSSLKIMRLNINRNNGDLYHSNREFITICHKY